MRAAPEHRPVGVLYQATAPPVIDGIRKPRKPGGYSDSGADIAYVLQAEGRSVVTPVSTPDPVADEEWVFPDTVEGIQSALDAGAEVLWANTVLFGGHPLEQYLDRDVAVVGQHPRQVHRFDDKWHTNELLRAQGCPVARAALVAAEPREGVHAVDGLSAGDLERLGLGLPAVVKPIRGRGSQGVTRVETVDHLRAVVHELLATTVEVDGETYPTYGDALILEEYLPGTEVTVTVMPPGTYVVDDAERHHDQHWSLSPVERTGHVDGVTPYNGVVAVTANSRAVTELDDELNELLGHCATAARLVGARAPIRIDCRARAGGEVQLFDLNMKPNMTGAGRPGREDQDSLSCMAARVIGWSYGDLLENMLRQAWSAREPARQPA